MNSKNLLIIFVVIFMNMTYAMKNELISFKSLHGFPLISWDNASKWAGKLPKKELQDVREQILWQNDTRLAALFYMRKLPQDIKKLIVAHLFKEKKDDNIADIFCKTPLYDAFDRYAILQQLSDNPKNFWFVKDCPLPQHLFFEYAHDLKVYRHVMNIGICNFRYCSEKELAILARVNNVFGEFIEQHKHYPYQFRNKITVDHIKQACRENLSNQVILFPVVIAVYMIFMFPFKMDCIRDQRRVDYNDAADELNKAIQVFNNKISCLEQRAGMWLYPYKSYVGMLQEYPCRERVTLYRVLAGVIWGGFGGVFLYRHEQDVKQFTIKNLIATLIGMGSFLKAMSYIASQTQENLLGGVEYVSWLYVLLCSGYNIYKVQQVQPKKILLKNIQALLQRTDIEII